MIQTLIYFSIKLYRIMKILYCTWLSSYSTETFYDDLWVLDMAISQTLFLGNGRVTYLHMHMIIYALSIIIVITHPCLYVLSKLYFNDMLDM